MRYTPLFYCISRIRQKWFLRLNCTTHFKISYLYYKVLYLSHLTNISLYKHNRLTRIFTMRRLATYVSFTCLLLLPRFTIYRQTSVVALAKLQQIFRLLFKYAYTFRTHLKSARGYFNLLQFMKFVFRRRNACSSENILLSINK
jgi:hypothetical protein